MKKDITPICLSAQRSIRDALQTLAAHRPAETNLPAGILLIVDPRSRLEGIATDGDLRRALAGGFPLDAPLSSVMNRDVFYVEGPIGSTEILSRATTKIRERGWHKNRLEKIIIVDADCHILDVVSFFDLWQSSDVRAKRIGIVGLGFVGLSLGLTLADLGFDVLGCDTNARLTSLIKRQKSPFFEAGLERLLADHLNQRFKLVDAFAGRNQADVYFVAVGTPVAENGRPSMEFITSAAEGLGKILKQGDTVIVRSTVPVGTTRSVVTPILARESNLSAGEDFFVAFAPERTVEGKALEELRILPQVVGGINRASANIASNIFNLMTDSVFIVDSLEEAELVKLINNTYRDVTFAFANEVSLVCQKWGIDTNKVINAANMGYPRSNVPKPSPGVGGYCLEKDPFLFIDSAKRRGYEPRIAPYARAVNDSMVNELGNSIAAFFKQYKKRHPKIFIMGFAFKGNPPTCDMRGSSSLKLLKILRAKRFNNIVGYDPQVSRKAIAALGIEVAASPVQGARDADAVIVMTNHPRFQTLDMRRTLSMAHNEVLLFDTWSLYNKDEMNKVKGMVYKHL